MYTHLIADAGRKRRCRAGFTLIELVVSMAIFAVMMLVMINIFTSAQRAWSKMSARTEMFENARIALDIMSRDIQSLYYENGKIPFWHKRFSPSAMAADGAEFRNEALAFVSATATPHSTGNSSRLFEVCYQLFYAEDFTTLTNPIYAGWLLRSVTGDGGATPNAKWNFYCDVAPPGNWTTAPDKVVSKNTATCTFTTNVQSRDDFQKLIPYVTELEFTCLRQKDNAGNPEIEALAATDEDTPSELPYAIMIKLSVLDGVSWEKWKAMGGLPHQPMHDLAGEPAAAQRFREENQRTFTKTVLIGDRGQY